ncbi:glutathione S-transferase family protein [Fulvimarina sp. MAC8]|uniref:glutathione S-transferase family protein n=1 Tax=Fulvimarina sp. MAC8 TaxID=3162874 RepID=UPI0032EE098D
MNEPIKLYFNARSRAVTARWMLEEVGATYELTPIDFEKGEQHSAEFLALNPMGKIPTLVLPSGTVVTETPAILLTLADLFPAAGLTPDIGTDERALCYRWLFFGGSCFEPAMTIEMAAKLKEPLPPQMVGWADWKRVLDTLTAQLSDHSYLCGSAPNVADIFIGAQLIWARMFGAPGITDNPVLSAYADGMAARPACRKVFEFG